MNNMYIQKKLAADCPKKVSEYTTSDQVVIWALRVWAKNTRKNANVYAPIIDGFRQFGAGQAAMCLILLMEAILAGLNRNIEINCTCYIKVGSDEALLLHLFALCQNGRSEQIEPLLAEFLNSDHIKLCRPLFRDFANALMSGGLFLSAEWLRNVPSQDQREVDPISTAIH